MSVGGERGRAIATATAAGQLHWLQWLCSALLFCFALLPLAAASASLQAVPALSGHVIDLTATLSTQQQQALENKLASFEAERGSQIVLLLVSSTAPEDIAAYAWRVADSWKIGRRDIGDGILVVVAKDDRRIRIEVARALEGAVPDLAAHQIIDRLITPAFRQDHYAAGLDAGIEGLMARIRGEELPLPGSTAAAAEGGLADFTVLLFVLVPIVGSVLVGWLGRKKGALATGGLIGVVSQLFTGSLAISVLAGVATILFVLILGIGGGGGGGPGGMGRHGPLIRGRWPRGGSLGGGGGFRSGGGGSFGGGGASGRW